MENPAVLLPEFLLFFSGALATFVAWALYFTTGSNSVKHIETLRLNLRKIGYAWSTNNGEAVPLENFEVEKERKKTLYTYGILVAVMSFLSWGGFVFSLILMLSMKCLPTRFEKRVYASDLTTNPHLEPEKVAEIWRSISN